MGQPVILSFALSVEEWARVSAALQAADILVEQRSVEIGVKPPVEVTAMQDTIKTFARMVNDEMHRALS